MPWGVAENEIEASSGVKDIGESELPVEEPIP
jgi:hypothetical protein